jgi:hypothetical protein
VPYWPDQLRDVLRAFYPPEGPADVLGYLKGSETQWSSASGCNGCKHLAPEGDATQTSIFDLGKHSTNRGGMGQCRRARP